MLSVGQKLYGFCGGWFGRDSYNDKRIEAVGVDWIVARDERGDVHVATGEDLQERLQEYIKPPEEDEDW